MNDLEFQKTNAGRTFGIASLILGIFSLFLALVPLVGILALIPAVLGILLSIIGLAQAAHDNGRKPLIYTALAASILSTILISVYLSFFAATLQPENITPEKNVIEIETDSILNDSATQKELEKTLEDFEEELSPKTTDSKNTDSLSSQKK